MDKIYKIKHFYDTNDDSSEYIKSNYSKEEIINLLVGIQFYIEITTQTGINCVVNNDMLAYILCSFYGCKYVSKNMTDKNMNIEEIDMYFEREKRCGDNYIDYIINLRVNSKPKAFFDLCKIYDYAELEKMDMDAGDFKIADLSNGKVYQILDSDKPLMEKKRLLKGLIL